MDFSPSELAWRISLCIILVGFAAVFSGLTLAVMSQDVGQLKIIMEAGSPRDRRYAARILTVRKDGNLLLCTLLWGNMLVNSLLSVTMAGLGGELVGVLVSTPLLVLFGEILPQSVCSRYGLRVGSFFTPFLRIMILIMYPISKPISLALDHFLGEEIGTLYSKKEMQSLLQMHVATNMLHPREAAIMSGAITFREKLVRDVATPADRMFALKASDRLDYRLMTQVGGAAAGNTRTHPYEEVPVPTRVYSFHSRAPPCMSLSPNNIFSLRCTARATPASPCGRMTRLPSWVCSTQRTSCW